MILNTQQRANATRKAGGQTDRHCLAVLFVVKGGEDPGTKEEQLQLLPLTSVTCCCKAKLKA